MCEGLAHIINGRSAPNEASDSISAEEIAAIAQTFANFRPETLRNHGGVFLPYPPEHLRSNEDIQTDGKDVIPVTE